MVPEAPLEQTEAGLVPGGLGWFVLNARDARWNHRPGRQSVSFTGSMVRALSEVGAVAISRRLASKSLDLPPTT